MVVRLIERAFYPRWGIHMEEYIMLASGFVDIMEAFVFIFKNGLYLLFFWIVYSWRVSVIAISSCNRCYLENWSLIVVCMIRLVDVLYRLCCVLLLHWVHGYRPPFNCSLCLFRFHSCITLLRSCSTALLAGQRSDTDVCMCEDYGDDHSCLYASYCDAYSTV